MTTAEECTAESPCREANCPFCDPVGHLERGKQKHMFHGPGGYCLVCHLPRNNARHDQEGEEDADSEDGPEPLFADIAAILADGIPPPPEPVLLRRDDGHALFYAGKVNVLFGDPECGKTWIALAAIVEALKDGRRAVFVDLDHNGVGEVISRLLALGATPKQLGNQDVFRYAEPYDEEQLIAVVQALRAWKPAAAVVDSLGELLPLLGMSSNSPDDYTSAHRRTLTPIARVGAAVIVIDHLPKDDGARDKGQTGTLAKRRAVNGVTLRVTVAETFAPGHGGAASMTVAKDRPGGVRAHCPIVGKNQPAGRFVMTASPDGTIDWRVTEPRVEATARGSDADVAELDSLDPPPASQRDVQKRLQWGAPRAMKALQMWRDLQEQGITGPGR
ncbi:AAA family ATPase [Actinoplanes sp. NPDC048791]|uniref:AAA family ATPase n=1 Tax=Actinoplanes sp. NPDC048791 TaxID=3154623 RepID=UPI00340C6942